ncbi:MAG: hypothetical protein L0210_07785 [Rhodospirillales bacterium]|nr:hypothetical protein [Rhodospirillales bacterium]
MANRHDLDDWVFEALKGLDGKAPIARIAEHIWQRHENDLRRSGDLFYTWQYEMRWAAQRLYRAGKLKNRDSTSRGTWELAS